jgi:hypothetical protein
MRPCHDRVEVEFGYLRHLIDQRPRRSSRSSTAAVDRPLVSM